MSTKGWLILILPLLEIVGFVVIGGLIGVGFTLLWVIVSAVIGVVIIRTEGIVIFQQVMQSMQQGEELTRAVFSGALFALGGVLLVMPGFFTDAMGLLLLISGVREHLITLLVKRGAIVIQDAHVNQVIEGDYWRDDD